MSEPELKVRLKALNKARAALPKDDRDGRATLSREIKAVKKKLNAAKTFEAATPEHAEATNRGTIEPAEDYTGDISIHVNDMEGWDDFVSSCSDASHYHYSGWRTILADVMGRDLRYLSAKSGQGELLGVLPIALTRSRLFGSYGVSLPYFNYGGALSLAPNVVAALMEHAFTRTGEWGVDYIEIRSDRCLQSLDARTDKVCMKLALDQFEDFNDLMAFLPAKVRSQVKKSQSNGLELKLGGLALVDDFYAVFAEHMRDLGTPVYARKLFSSILETFPDDAHLGVGYVDGQPVSCAFLIEHDRRWEIPWASTLRSAHKLNANMSMYAGILDKVISRKGREFDFGRSSIDAPTYRFKKQWGALPHQCYWYYSDPSRAYALSTENTKFSLAIQAWQRLPVSLTKLLGPRIVRNLP